MYEAKVVADSVSPWGARITSMQLRYPLIIHAEMCRHRCFSRSVASNRAIPTAKQLTTVKDTPYIPEQWGTNIPGMSAGPPLEGAYHNAADTFWLDARDAALERVRCLLNLEVHKQWTNRLLSPFQWVTEIITGTDWANFFALRVHPAAQPEMQKIAGMMKGAYDSSEPEEMHVGGWHLPYIKEVDFEWSYNRVEDLSVGAAQRDLARISAMRCARVSYLTHDREDPDPRKDLSDFEEKLNKQVPKHAAPMEHQAMCMPHSLNEISMPSFSDSGEVNGMFRVRQEARWGNLRGWYPFRMMLPGHVVEG